jgi:hypothetical protein
MAMFYTYRASRTIVLNGVPSDATVQQIKSFVRDVALSPLLSQRSLTRYLASQAASCGDVDGVEFPVIEAPNKAYVLFKRSDSAMEAETKLPNQKLLDKVITASLFSTAALKQYRLIVRNLAWETTIEDLQKTFSPYGKLYEIHMPPGKTPGTARGFAFVNYTNATDAQKAVQKCNGKMLRGRAVAVDITVPKEQYEAAIAEEKAAKAELDAKYVLLLFLQLLMSLSIHLRVRLAVCRNAPASSKKEKKLYGSAESSSDVGDSDDDEGKSAASDEEEGASDDEASRSDEEGSSGEDSDADGSQDADDDDDDDDGDDEDGSNEDSDEDANGPKKHHGSYLILSMLIWE